MAIIENEIFVETFCPWKLIQERTGRSARNWDNHDLSIMVNLFIWSLFDDLCMAETVMIMFKVIHI